MLSAYSMVFVLSCFLTFQPVRRPAVLGATLARLFASFMMHLRPPFLLREMLPLNGSTFK